MDAELYNRTLSRLQALCSRREYCRSDLFRKACEAMDGDRNAAAALVDSLAADRFVDDLRYASAFARDKARLSGWGPAKIAFQLSGKGIEKDVIREALAEIEPEELDRKMRAVLEAKHKILQGDPQEKLKLLKFALSRGYEYEAVAKTVAEIFAEK